VTGVLLGGAALAFGLYFALVVLLYLQQGRLLYPASTLRTSAAQARLAGVEDVEIRTEDGETIVGWWKPPEPGRALILYFHGNGGSLLNRRDRVRLLTHEGRGCSWSATAAIRARPGHRAKKACGRTHVPRLPG
jgi:uncharacterized protein